MEEFRKKLFLDMKGNKLGRHELADFWTWKSKFYLMLRNPPLTTFFDKSNSVWVSSSVKHNVLSCYDAETLCLTSIRKSNLI